MNNNNYLITPQSDIYLIKCPIESDSLNQIDFSSTTAQHNYFNGLPKLYMDNATYVRKDGRLYFEGNYDDLIGYNYCMYRNEGFSNKWFYAFISDMRYESNNSVSVDIQTDVYQTWMFNFTLKRSFIERSHVAKSNDTIGAYTIPENFELGEFTCNGTERPAYQDLNLNTLLVMAINKPLTPLTDSANTHMYGGLFSGLYYLAFHTPQDCAKCIFGLDSEGQGEVVESLFILPNKLLNITSWSTVQIGTQTFEVSAIQNSINPVRISHDDIITRNTTLNGYTPKNNKLFCWPFNYILASNNSGQTAIYHYEDFNNTNKNGDFDVVGTISQGGSIRLIPKNYKNIGDDTSPTDCNTYGLSGAKYPTCAWVNDSYTNWLTQNSVNLGIQYAGAIGQMAIGAGFAVAGDYIHGAEGLVGGAMQIGDLLQAVHQAEFIPNQVGGSANAGDIQYSAHMMHFDIYKMSIKYEYAKIIDDYFTMYGYKLNSVAVPNTTSRSNWNYIKTVGVNILGDIPEQDMQKLKSLYNNGFTIWHTTTHYLDYSQNNT